ncbi:hypothetical protein F4604DRAFT_1685792 [Suillus subluteus]|nr:hypothetical protein F4604DRAFT_1685792 [Suillus subluteus]
MLRECRNVHVTGGNLLLDPCDPQLASYSSEGLSQLKNDAIEKVQMLVPVKEAECSYDFDASKLGSFTVDEGPLKSVSHNFYLHAPTARDNAMKAVKGLKVVLLEGYQLCQINLFDQTDLMNLFGSDPFVENGYPGEFAWKDNEFLTAVQEGHRFLLVEMSLAPQAIFEGVNTVLDLYTFPSLGDPSSGIPSSWHRIHSKQGGGRKGLTRTFLDLFTKTFLSAESVSEVVARTCYAPRSHMTTVLNQEVVHRSTFGRDGSPSEFNVHDVLRWESYRNPCQFHTILVISCGSSTSAGSGLSPIVTAPNVYWMNDANSYSAIRPRRPLQSTLYYTGSHWGMSLQFVGTTQWFREDGSSHAAQVLSTLADENLRMKRGPYCIAFGSYNQFEQVDGPLLVDLELAPNYLVNRSRVAIPEAKRLANVSALLNAAISPTYGLGLTEMRTYLFAPTTIEVSSRDLKS